MKKRCYKIKGNSTRDFLFPTIYYVIIHLDGMLNGVLVQLDKIKVLVMKIILIKKKKHHIHLVSVGQNGLRNLFEETSQV